jgi:hypothetical protein
VREVILFDWFSGLPVDCLFLVSVFTGFCWFGEVFLAGIWGIFRDFEGLINYL